MIRIDRMLQGSVPWSPREVSAIDRQAAMSWFRMSTSRLSCQTSGEASKTRRSRVFAEQSIPVIRRKVASKGGR